MTLKLLRESALPKRLFTNFFQYVIVDEFQDTDTQQLDLTQIMVESAVIGSLIVADDDQSIYAFRGANRANVYEIEERLGARRVVLGANFRSDQVIVEAAQAVISYEESRSPRSITATSSMRGHLYMTGFADPEAEANQVEEWVNSLIEQQAVGDLGQIAVITRDRWRANQVLQAFDNGQVPWFDRARLTFQDSWETSLGLAILAMAVDLDSSEGLHRVMTAVEDGGLAYNMRDEDALDTARRVRQLLIVNFCGEPSPYNAMEVLKAAGIDDIIERNSWSVTEALRFAANLDLMIKEVVKQADEHDLDLLQIIDRLAGYGAVQVMSGHGSKGKEFPYVFMVGLEDDVLPNYRTHDNPDAISEERRVFYVSLTRAKKAAYLTYVRQRVMPWGETRAVRKSRFLETIPQQLFTTLY